MSFDVYLTHYEDGEAVQADRQAVRRILQREKHSQPAGSGWYGIDFKDGVHVEWGL